MRQNKTSEATTVIYSHCSGLSPCPIGLDMGSATEITIKARPLNTFKLRKQHGVINPLHNSEIKAHHASE